MLFLSVSDNLLQDACIICQKVLIILRYYTKHTKFSFVVQLPLSNKAILEPRVSPAFAITYFCNYCNIRFENTSKYVDTLTLFSKNINQRSLNPRWPLTPCLLRSHVWLYPRIIVSKSHDNTSMYVDTVINFAKYHIHTHIYYVHTTYLLRTYYVQNEWSHSLLLNSVQARQQVQFTHCLFHIKSLCKVKASKFRIYFYEIWWDTLIESWDQLC